MRKDNSQTSGFSNVYMNAALDLAKQAMQEDEVPVGAVIVDPKSSKIISKAYNMTQATQDPTAHAELIAIKEACQIISSKNLSRYDLYVTLEPCAMCATAISYARISRLYFGAYDTKYGAIDNGVKIFQSSTTLYKPEIYGGISEEECSLLLKNFFKQKR